MSCATGLSLVPTSTITPSNRITRRTQTKLRRFGRGRGSAGGSTTTSGGTPSGWLAAAAVFAGAPTGLPHFRQNCASDGKLAPHWLHPSVAEKNGAPVLLPAVFAGCPHFGQNCKPSGRLA